MAVDVTEYHLSVIKSPPGWEVGVYAAGALALLGIAAVSLWRLWTSGSFPSPSPFPNYDYRYLQQKYGEASAEARRKRISAWNGQRPSTRGPPSRKGSLSLEDTLESVSELGPLELMGRELDLAPYGPLRKSQSADSLNSISSVSNTFGQDFTLGQVEVSMDYAAASHTLHVAVLQGRDLLEREEASFESCFMRVSLLPDEQIVGISRLQRNAYSIFFDEKFSVPLEPAALEEKSLRFSVFGIDEDERNVSTGVVELKLSVLDLPLQPFSGWLYLQDQNKVPDAVGEILLSLSYLPTAERLTVVVVKAKNLVWTNDKTTADPFVKVYLLQDGRKMSKKKTAVKRDDPNPVFNEAMIFSVPALLLQVRHGNPHAPSHGAAVTQQPRGRASPLVGAGDGGEPRSWCSASIGARRQRGTTEAWGGVRPSHPGLQSPSPGCLLSSRLPPGRPPPSWDITGRGWGAVHCMHPSGPAYIPQRTGISPPPSILWHS
uniref:Synaptotagmin 12 n=1 Tax=Oryctolagus cuniculus TaxID=9986 RepID=A0A5F9C6M5_RABIT